MKKKYCPPQLLSVPFVFTHSLLVGSGNEIPVDTTGEGVDAGTSLFRRFYLDDEEENY